MKQNVFGGGLILQQSLRKIFADLRRGDFMFSLLKNSSFPPVPKQHNHTRVCLSVVIWFSSVLLEVLLMSAIDTHMYSLNFHTLVTATRC